MTRPRLLFVVMSAVHSARAVDQLASALQPHAVLVHHDFAQTPRFELSSANACFVPEPKRTGWACWGFTEGIFHALGHALRAHQFDYLQLLSPTCLPIRPIVEFENHVAQAGFDAHFEGVDVLANPDALMSVGYRSFAPEHTLRHRVLRHLSWAHHRGGDRAEQYPAAGVSLYRASPKAPATDWSLTTMLARLATRAFSHRTIGRHVFNSEFRPYFGSVWFGARHAVIERMLEQYQRAEVQGYMSRLHIADEFVIPTLLRLSSVSAGPLNHLIKEFNGAHPGWLDVEDVPLLEASDRYFARKFRDYPDDPARWQVLARLSRVDHATSADRDAA
jgi:hypothetical protein